ncbi:polysaccharide biosynthesis/export family protein [Rubritalea marina]|uniref:polysaccharide biosynthesis/export family protein n=1 Tax=Rubritalea marina TaxID=361055 RepID=UPI00036419E5|nr:polysaccharide biosynthesis/export family protein [Rubritalea marina]
MKMRFIILFIMVMATGNAWSEPAPAGSVESSNPEVSVAESDLQESEVPAVDLTPPRDLVREAEAQNPQEESWRDRYELGPGDVINFSLFGRPELDREGFRISPDGRISYLQAQNIMVNGLTIDEARMKIEEGLKSHFKSPRVIITPEEIGSKRFSILGKVLKKGVYTLDSPMTLVEAVAQAGGLETGLFERKTVEIADMDRSFIARGDVHLPVDFRKLFNEGDLSQNVGLEPNDFIYIASAVANDYYVLGAVNNPGVQGYTPDATLISALSRRGGVTDRAYTDKVLIVRGSFSNPETHVISLKNILAADERDFKLLPDDIVFVAERPWIIAEDVMKLAVSAFATSLASTWINNNTTQTSE